MLALARTMLLPIKCERNTNLNGQFSSILSLALPLLFADSNSGKWEPPKPKQKRRPGRPAKTASARARSAKAPGTLARRKTKPSKDISCFVVPRQIFWLGDPGPRSADACESYGALVKKLIKHSTCRRRIRGGTSGEGPAFTHAHKRGIKKWRQTFSRGYIEQAFRRCCVKEKLLHGKANEPFLQRTDWKLKAKGVKSESKSTERVVPPTVRSCLAVEVDM